MPLLNNIIRYKNILVVDGGHPSEVEGNCEIVELYEIFNIFVQRE
jgi:hypothetical protein